MIHYLTLLVGAGFLGAGAAMVADTTTVTPLWALMVIPVIPVLVGYLLTRGKLKKQDAKVQEIHVLVNSRLSKTLDALSSALTENIALKGRLGIEISDHEREIAQATKLEANDTPKTS